jgi:hypothetical protein
VSLAITISIGDVIRLESAKGPFLVDHDTVVAEPVRRDSSISSFN